MIFFLISLGILNLASFIAFGIDKRKAKRGMWRIPEKTLFLLVLSGGSAGGWIGMILFSHKTQHKKFTVGIPAIFLLQLFVLYFVLNG
ncbi:MAG: DUF1294 domain-containing protein [Bacteroidales bacterium]